MKEIHILSMAMAPDIVMSQDPPPCQRIEIVCDDNGTTPRPRVSIQWTRPGL